jgi:acyl dehydratase
MKIGIKYCGGCNSRYDRTREVKKLQEQFPQHTFVYDTADTKFCDIWVVVCGCITACASTDSLVAARKMFIVHFPRDFAEVVAYLEQIGPKESVRIREKRILRIGDSASMAKKFSAVDIAAFARLTGDFGKIHMDENFAAEYGFGRPVVHGVLTGSLLSSVMGMQLPGDGTILMDEKICFVAPVYAGDTIMAMVTLKNIKQMKRFYIAAFYGCCRNQNKEIVAEGTFHQMLMMNLFEIRTDR